MKKIISLWIIGIGASITISVILFIVLLILNGSMQILFSDPKAGLSFLITPCVPLLAGIAIPYIGIRNIRK